MSKAKRILELIVKQKHNLKAGDKVKLAPDALQKHARSVPAHAGYSREQFQWRDTLRALTGKVGTIERIFPDSDHVNVGFESGQLIGIDAGSLVKEEGK